MTIEVRCSVFIAASIDGFIATEDDGLEWLENYDNPTGTDYGYGEFTSEIDALVMGRRTYEKVLTFSEWPYEKPVYVMTSTMKADTGTHTAQVVRGGPAAVVDRAIKDGNLRLYVDGGRTIQSFLVDDLIDEMIITTVPVVLGDGLPLFGRLDTQRPFEVSRSAQMGPFVQSRFVRSR